MKPKLNAAKTKHLRLNYDAPLSSVAFKSNLRRYTSEYKRVLTPSYKLQVGRCRLSPSCPQVDLRMTSG